MKIFKAMIWVLCGLIGIFVLGLGLASFLPGYHTYIVLSDSMKPLYAAGDLIITKPIDGVVAIGTILTYQKGSDLITHRVVAVTDGGVITRGDNNDTEDSPAVSLSQIKGAYMMTLPRLGYISAFLHTRTGWLVSVLVPGMSLLGWIIMDIWREALKPKGSEAAEGRSVKRREKIPRPVKEAQVGLMTPGWKFTRLTKAAFKEKVALSSMAISGEKVVRTDKVLRIDKITCIEKVRHSVNVARKERIIRDAQLIQAMKADRRYYEAFKPRRARNVLV